MADPAGVRAWLTGHVEAAVRAASPPGHEPFATAAAEAAAALGHDESAAGPPPPVSWEQLRAGTVDWASLLTEALARRGWRQVGAAALLRGATAGLLEPFLTPGEEGVEPASLRGVGWSSEAVAAFVAFGLGAGWFVARDGRLFGDEIRALAGFGTIDSPGAWLRRRLQFELDWFWSPVGRLRSAVRTGVAPASFAASAGSGQFRGASTAMNLPAVRLRTPAALAVARLLGLGERPVRILELGTGTAAWSRAFAAHPGSAVTTVDHAEVGAVVAPAVEASFAGRYTWIAADPSTVPEDNPFDVVVVPELLHTLAPAAVPGFLRSAASVLAPAGALVIADPLLDSARRTPTGYLLMQVKLAVTGGGRVWDVAALRAALVEAGLAPQRPRTVGGSQIMIARRP